MAQQRETAERPVAKSLHEYARGVAGGLLFSLPLLFTEEIWITGILASPWRLLAYVGATFVLLIGINHYAGLRRDRSFIEVVIEAVEEMGIGLVIACLMLWLLDLISFNEPVNEIIGESVVAAMTVAVGVSIGTSQLGGGKTDGADKQEAQGDTSADDDTGADAAGGDASGIGGQIVTTWCGAVLFAASIAPSDEVARIAGLASLWKIVGLAVVSLLLGALVLYYSEFTGAPELTGSDTSFTVLSGTLVTYAVALAACAMSLWFYGRFEGASLVACLAQMVVLGIAATLGASAGRLLLQG